MQESNKRRNQKKKQKQRKAERRVCNFVIDFLKVIRINKINSIYLNSSRYLYKLLSAPFNLLSLSILLKSIKIKLKCLHSSQLFHQKKINHFHLLKQFLPKLLSSQARSQRYQERRSISTDSRYVIFREKEFKGFSIAQSER